MYMASDVKHARAASVSRVPHAALRRVNRSRKCCSSIPRSYDLKSLQVKGASPLVAVSLVSWRTIAMSEE